MTKRKAEFKPEATDGDQDGYVQDGTIYERPVEAETLDTPSEALEGTSEPSTPVQGQSHATASEGDSYASLAAQFLPAGMTKHDYAVELYKKNGEVSLRAGMTIKL